MLTARVQIKEITREAAGEPEERAVVTFAHDVASEHNAAWAAPVPGPMPFNLTVTVKPSVAKELVKGGFYILELVPESDEMEETTPEPEKKSAKDKSTK